MKTTKSKITASPESGKACKHCKKPIPANRKNKIYCSHSCRQKAFVKRHASPKISIVINVENHKGWFAKLLSWIFSGNKKNEKDIVQESIQSAGE